MKKSIVLKTTMSCLLGCLRPRFEAQQDEGKAAVPPRRRGGPPPMVEVKDYEVASAGDSEQRQNSVERGARGVDALVKSGLSAGRIPIFNPAALSRSFDCCNIACAMLRIDKPSQHCHARHDSDSASPSPAHTPQASGGSFSFKPSWTPSEFGSKRKCVEGADGRHAVPGLARISGEAGEAGASGAAAAAAMTEDNSGGGGGSGEHTLEMVCASEAALAMFGVGSQAEYGSELQEMMVRDPRLEALVMDVLRSLIHGELTEAAHATPDVKEGAACVWVNVQLSPCAVEDSLGRRWPAVLLTHSLPPTASASALAEQNMQQQQQQHWSSSAMPSPGGTRMHPVTWSAASYGPVTGSGGSGGGAIAATAARPPPPSGCSLAAQQLQRDYMIASHSQHITTIIDYSSRVVHQNAASLAYYGCLSDLRPPAGASDPFATIRHMFREDPGKLLQLADALSYDEEWTGIVRMPHEGRLTVRDLGWRDRRPAAPSCAALVAEMAHNVGGTDLRVSSSGLMFAVSCAAAGGGLERLGQATVSSSTVLELGSMRSQALLSQGSGADSLLDSTGLHSGYFTHGGSLGPSRMGTGALSATATAAGIVGVGSDMSRMGTGLTDRGFGSAQQSQAWDQASAGDVASAGSVRASLDTAGGSSARMSLEHQQPSSGAGLREPRTTGGNQPAAAAAPPAPLARAISGGGASGRSTGRSLRRNSFLLAPDSQLELLAAAASTSPSSVEPSWLSVAGSHRFKAGREELLGMAAAGGSDRRRTSALSVGTGGRSGNVSEELPKISLGPLQEQQQQQQQQQQQHRLHYNAADESPCSSNAASTGTNLSAAANGGASFSASFAVPPQPRVSKSGRRNSAPAMVDRASAPGCSSVGNSAGSNALSKSSIIPKLMAARLSGTNGGASLVETLGAAPLRGSGGSGAGIATGAGATSSVGGVGGGGSGGVCFHAVHAKRVIDVVTGDDVILLVQDDITSKVLLEKQLEALLESEHRLLEAIFPRHIIEHLALASDRQQQHAAPPVTTTTTTEGGGAVAAGQPPQTPDAAAQQPQQQQVLSITRIAHSPSLLATQHEAVTVLFADIVGFTSMCQEQPPEVVMKFLNDLYTRFDDMLDIFQVYKVETIGDCYMVAGGLMGRDEDGFKSVRTQVDKLHAVKVMDFAKSMLRECQRVVLPGTASAPVKMRIGIHSGSVVSGIVGSKMPRFCLFGDTINTASRMESTSRPGCIHVSHATRSLLDHEPWLPTGGVDVKGKGRMETYLWDQESAPQEFPRAGLPGGRGKADAVWQSLAQLSTHSAALHSRLAAAAGQPHSRLPDVAEHGRDVLSAAGALHHVTNSRLLRAPPPPRQWSLPADAMARVQRSGRTSSGTPLYAPNGQASSLDGSSYILPPPRTTFDGSRSSLGPLGGRAGSGGTRRREPEAMSVSSAEARPGSAWPRITYDGVNRGFSALSSLEPRANVSPTGSGAVDGPPPPA